jgi:site-specific recombinase XerD
MPPSGVPGDVVFWNQKRPSRPLSAKAIQKKMARDANAAGIVASCHRLRQTCASNVLEQGAEIVSMRE